VTGARLWIALALAAVGLMLSPLTMWFALAIVAVVVLAAHGLPPGERRFVVSMVALAVVLRVAVVGALFVSTNHAHVPFGTFFGDEDYFVKRSVWLRNIALGTPVHPFDLEYAFEPSGRSGFLDVLAFVHIAAGVSPYGVRLLNIAFYIAAVLLLHREARLRFGRVPAAFGLVVLLFTPTLVVWSLSVLKEPLFILSSAATVVLAREIVAPAAWPRRLAMILAFAAAAAAFQAVRDGGVAFVALAVSSGLAVGALVCRPRLLLALAIAVPIAIGAMLRLPDVQLKAYAAVQSMARQHWGAVVVSRGYGYRSLDDRFYTDLNSISSLGLGETMRFLGRSVAYYVVVPRPRDVQSIWAAAYVPELVLWYALLAFAAAGALFAWRRDPLLAGLLIAHALLIAAASAFTDGNIGTLVRHRGLAMPYLVWIAGVGGAELLGAAARRAAVPSVPLLQPDVFGMRSI
jgi:hypothetical protein